MIFSEHLSAAPQGDADGPLMIGGTIRRRSTYVVA
jgi:hypothetical protein